MTRALRALATFALLGFALYGAGLLDREGWARIAQTIGSPDWRFLALSVLFIPIMDAVSTLKWHALTQARQMPVSFGALFGYYVVGRFYNLVLPSSIGGDLIRVHLLGRRTARYADAAAIVFVERFTGVVTLVLIAAGALVLASFEDSRAALWGTLAAAGVALAGMLWVVGHPPVLARLDAALGRRLPPSSAVFAKLKKLQDAILEFRHDGRALQIAMLNSLLFYAAAIVNTWVALRVFVPDVPLWQMAIPVPLVMFIMNLPVSIGNLGIMEFGYTFVLTQFGIPGDVALATALLMRLKLILGGAIGALLNLFIGGAPPPVENLESTRRLAGATTRTGESG